MQDEPKLESVSNVQCPNCGSKEVGYSAEEKKLRCPHCTHTWELPRNSDKIVERHLGEGFELGEMETGFGTETKMFHCQACGANAAVAGNQVRLNCAFCGSENLNEAAMDTRMIQPAGLLPFTHPQKRAFDSFTTWIGAGWFHPNNLSKVAEIGKLKGVYLPFWTYDAQTQSQWTAEAGYYYYETESYTDSDGNSQTRQVQKTRWVPASGYYEHFFDDVLIVASKGVSQEMTEGIMPFNLEETVNYDSQYILGWECEVYQKDIKQGFGAADRIMDNYLEQACGEQVPGDTFRFLNVSTRKNDLTFKHLLLPVWIAAYTYNGKIFQFIVNGQTGSIHGEKPLSFWKIFFTVLFSIIVIGVAIYFYAENQK